MLEHIKAGDYTATIDLSAGANCIRLRNEKYRAVLLREPPENPDNPYLYGMPVLFPVNRISGGRFWFQGREYVFPINEPATGCHLHGVLHRTPFSLLAKTEHSLSCIYHASKDHPYLQFPHEFAIRMDYELSEEGLLHTTRVTNLSQTDMPLLLGFHTTFNTWFCPGSGRIRVRVPIIREYERNMENYLPTGSTPSFDEVSSALNAGSFDPFSAPTSRHYRSDGNMVIYDPDNDLSIVYENDKKFGFRLVYNGNADGYICLEPQTSLANSPNSPIDREEAGFGWIGPGQTECFRSKIYLAEGDQR